MKQRVRPYHLVIGFGVFWGLFSIASGLGPLVFGWFDDSPVQREVFFNIPGPWKLAFYTLLPVVFVYGSVLFANRVRNWERGAPDARATNPSTAPKRLADFRAGVYMQTLLRDPAAGLMHSLIYFSFLILFAVTAVSQIQDQVPEGWKFLHGTTYQAYSFVGDAAGVLFVIGVGWAMVRRYVQRPYRIRIKSKPEHLLILGLFLVLGVSGFVAEAFRIAFLGRPDFEKWSFVGYSLSWVVRDVSHLHGWQQAMWATHVLSFFVFLAILPVTMIRHMFTSPLNMYSRQRERPKGAMKAMPNLMETELESFGAATVEDFTWKQLLDTDACTMCGRCTSVCEDGRSDGPHRHTARVASDRRRPRGHGLRQLVVRAHHRRRGLGLHLVQGLRRDLSGQHRDPRQDPRHAALPLAHGVELPHRARQRLPIDGELEQPVGHEPE